MSKKINNKAIDATVENTTPATETPVADKAPLFDLKAQFEKYPNASLRKLALACEMSYGYILKKSKEPIPGQAYDPSQINYDAVAAIFQRKQINLAELDWDALNEATLKRGALLTKDMSAFNVGGEVYLREDNKVPFVICYKTETHIVIMKKGGTEPRAWSHATFLMKGPVFEPRAISTENAEAEEA